MQCASRLVWQSWPRWVVALTVEEYISEPSWPLQVPRTKVSSLVPSSMEKKRLSRRDWRDVDNSRAFSQSLICSLPLSSSLESHFNSSRQLASVSGLSFTSRSSLSELYTFCWRILTSENKRQSGACQSHDEKRSQRREDGIRVGQSLRRNRDLGQMQI